MDNETKEVLQLILEKVSSLDSKVSSLEKGQQKLIQDVNAINLNLENIIEPKLQLIYENQVNVIENEKVLKLQNKRIEKLETDVSALQYAFKALKQG